MKKTIFTYAVISTAVGISLYAGSIAQGKVKATSCVGCHGASGISLNQGFPNLAGQKELYIFNQLKAFKSGARKNSTMSAMVAALSKKDMENLSAYYASLKTITKKPTVKKTMAMDKATSTEFPKTVYVSMKKDATMQNFPQQQTWTGGPNMLYNALTPNGKMLLSTSPSTGSVYVFDTKSGKQLAIIKVGKAPKGVKISPDGKIAYVSNQKSNDISVVDLNKLNVVYTIKVGKGPHNARFTKNGKIAYVTLQGGAGLGVIDVKSRKMIKVIPIAGITGPHNLDLSKDEKTAFVRDFVHNVAVLDLITGKVKKVIKVGNGHSGMDVTPDGKYAIAGAIGDTFLSVINTKTLNVQKIDLGTASHGVRASKDSKWLYVTLPKANAIAVINLHTMKIVKKIAVGKFPFWIAVQGNQ